MFCNYKSDLGCKGSAYLDTSNICIILYLSEKKLDLLPEIENDSRFQGYGQDDAVDSSPEMGAVPDISPSAPGHDGRIDQVQNPEYDRRHRKRDEKKVDAAGRIKQYAGKDNG